MPLTIAFEARLVLVKRTMTCPLRFQTRYMPLPNALIERVSRTLLPASRISMRSERGPFQPSQSSMYNATWWVVESVKLRSMVNDAGVNQHDAIRSLAEAFCIARMSAVELVQV